jgi:hypothetical protein
MALNIALDSIAVPIDTGGVVKAAPPEAVVDNIFIFADQDGNKWERVVDGKFRAAWLVNGLPGNQGPRLQAAFNHASIREVVFDSGDVLVNSTITIPTGKKITFRGNGAVTGTGTISGGIVDADPHAHIFNGV